MAEEISDIGDVNVWCVEDAINSVANGALNWLGDARRYVYFNQLKRLLVFELGRKYGLIDPK